MQPRANLPSREVQLARNDRATDQPRPALGRRPWFAFLRRARSLRRFALAMTAARVTEPPRVAIGTIDLRAPDWGVAGVHIAATPRARLVGLRGSSDEQALLLRGRSVHGFGMRRAVSIVALDAEGRVLGCATLHSRRLVFFPAATWILEVPAGRSTPPRGARLRVGTGS